jgi:hypothetical protein
MNNPSLTARRALVSLTALALSGGALAATTGSASAAPGDDIVGTVVSSAGTGIPNVNVYAFTTPADGSEPLFVDSALTDAAGNYALAGLDPAELAFFSNPAIQTETEFKLYFNWSPTNPADYHSTGYLDRGLGGSKTRRAAGSVVVPAGGTAIAPVQGLPSAGGVLLRVLNPAGAPVTDGFGELYEAGALDPFSAEFGGSASTGYDDPFYPDGVDADTLPDAPVDGLVFIAGVEPDSYVVDAFGSDPNFLTGGDVNYVSRLFGGDTYDKATPVDVAAGAFTPVTVQLTNVLTAIQEPRIIGNSSFGSKLKADPGTFTGGNNSNLDFAYQWFSGNKLVSTEDTYKLSKKNRGDKIKLVVTAIGDDFIGSATADKTSKVGEKSKVSVKKAGLGKFGVTVKVAKKKLAQKLGTPRGKVVLMTEDGETASKKVLLKGGSATLTARTKYLGEKLIVMYLGGGRLGSDTAATGGGKKK